MTAREVAWRAHPAIASIGLDAPHRSMQAFGPVVCVDLGVPQPWSVRSSSGLAEPDSDDALAALDWLRERGSAHGWQVTVPPEQVTSAVWSGLVEDYRLPMFATDSGTAAGIELVVPSGLTLDDDPSYDDVVTAYGGWMSDRQLAELLVVPSDLERDDRRFVVGYAGDRVVGCAFVWFGGGTGYLSGIGVVRDLRGRGYGRALTAAAARLAARGPDGWPVDLVWMHATAEGAALYGRMGFELVDTEIALTTP
jgi:ribosomal protein S18 acetylase RimI-like enzyme